jgi:hypothetical protein
VFGRLVTPAGEPIEKAMVFAFIADAAGCARRPSADGFGETAADGSYRFQMIGRDVTEPVCVLLAFGPPIGSTLGSPPDTAVTLAFRYSAPFDSARADATFAE